MTVDWCASAGALTPDLRHLVGGRRVRGDADRAIVKYSPRDGRELYALPDATPSVVEQAVANAREAADDGRWSRLGIDRRKEILYRLASLVDRHHEAFALMESLDVGKPISSALSFDVPYAAARIRSAADGAEHVYGKVFGVDSTNVSYELRRPVGVVAGIIGWNFPLVLAAEKIGPVLAMGNCLVLKPSELTSLSAVRLAELAVDAGVPEGVLNVVHGGASVGMALGSHFEIDLITFTGSSRTGKALLVAAGQSNMKRLVLECGGKAPNIVFDDCPDLDRVADSIIKRVFWNQGEVCTASSRLLIQGGVYEDLLQRVLDRVRRIMPSDPLDPNTEFGALVSSAHRDKVRHFVEMGQQQGARMIYESNMSGPFPEGFYLGPIVFDNVQSSHAIAREEIFGPVLSVLRFKSEAEAIQMANSTPYGLSAILWTQSLPRAHRMCLAIKAGWITVNATPQPSEGPGPGALVSGGHKESGLGVEGGLEGLATYSTASAVQMFV